MKSFHLLILLLMTGCKASSNVKGCLEGWIEFNCKYPKPSKTYQDIIIENPERRNIRSAQKDVWETKGHVSLYHDTKNKKLTVAIKRLERKDLGEYECKFKEFYLSKKKEVEVDIANTNGCQGQFIQTAYTSAKTTITCDYPGHKYKSIAKFFCRENDVTCEDILSINSPVRTNGAFSLTKTISGFSVSISNVSSHDAGVYWCGVDRGSHRAGLRKIQLEVKDITTLRVSPSIGESFTYLCEYPNGTPIKKFICKGEDPSVCTPLVSTTRTNRDNGKFSLKENILRTNLTITVTKVTTDDTGTYWCGAESISRYQSDPFFHRLVMTVDKSSVWTTAVGFSLRALLLLFMLAITFVISTRFSLCKKEKSKMEKQEIHEEIQEQSRGPI